MTPMEEFARQAAAETAMLENIMKGGRTSNENMHPYIDEKYVQKIKDDDSPEVQLRDESEMEAEPVSTGNQLDDRMCIEAVVPHNYKFDEQKSHELDLGGRTL